MTFRDASELAKESAKWASVVGGHTSDQAMKNLALAIEKLAQSQYELAEQLHKNE